jgi:hypothetical protein
MPVQAANDELTQLLGRVVDEIGVPVGELGRDAGLGKDTLRRWLRGITHPSLDSFRRFVLYLEREHEVDANELWQVWRSSRAIGGSGGREVPGRRAVRHR